MSENAFRIVGPISVTHEIRALVTEHDGVCSAPQPASSTADPLNAPISGGDIQAAAEVVTGVFTAGVTAIKFLEALLKLARSRKARVRVTNVNNKVTRVVATEQDTKDLSP